MWPPPAAAGIGLAVPHTERPPGEPEVRAWILGCRADFRALYTDVMLNDSAESAEFTWVELSKGVDPLEAGKEVGIHRYELQDDHQRAAPHGGHPSDNLLLGADDVIRECESNQGWGSPRRRR